MGYYDSEAEVYDEKRGGMDRARVAAEAVTRLAPVGRVLDVGGGTGIVSAELAALGFDVVVADASAGMLAVASDRLPGRLARCDATRLPVRDRSVDVVTAVWLLHLLPSAAGDAVLAEAARVLRPGGVLVSTVDKELAHRPVRGSDADDRKRVTAVCRCVGLEPGGTTTFSGRSSWGSSSGGDPVFTLAAFRSGG